MSNETTVRLSQIDNIGRHQGSRKRPWTRSRGLSADTDDDFRVWSGNDNETFYIMGLGGYGIVSVAAHLVGRQIKAMMGMILEGEIENAAAEHRRLLELFKVLFPGVETPSRSSTAVRKAGYDVGEPRLPLVGPDEATAAAIDAVVSGYTIDLPAPA